jgi:hypothetical protein
MSDRHVHDFVRLAPDLLVCACSQQRKPRIRVSMEQALYLEGLLRDVKADTWDDRAEAQKKGEPTLPYNRELRMLDTMLREIDWMKEYFGWTSDATNVPQGVSSSA